MKIANQIKWSGLALVLLHGSTNVFAAELISNQVEQPPDRLAAPESNRGLFRLSIFEFIPQLAAGMTYNNNIYATTVNHVDDFIWNLTPGLTAVALDSDDGKFLSLSYVANFNFYTVNATNNYVGQEANLSATLPLAKLTLGLQGSATIQQYAKVGSGQLTPAQTYLVNGTSKYEIGAKTSVQVNGNWTTEDGESLIGHTIWANSDWINYAYSEKLSLGLGFVFSYITIQDAPNQTDEQALVRAVYVVSEKVNLNATAGPDWRQYDGQRAGTLDPAVSIGGSYRVREGTTLNLTAFGQIHTSLDLSGQNYYGAGFNLNVVQRLADKWAITVLGGYENDRYYSVASGVAADDPNNLLTVGGSVSYQIRERWSASIFNYYRRQSGNASLQGFNNNQTGIQASWRY